MVRGRCLKFFLADQQERLFEEKGLSDHGEKCRERVEGFGHGSLEIASGALRPEDVAYQVGDSRADGDDKRYLQKCLDTAFFYNPTGFVSRKS